MVPSGGVMDFSFGENEERLREEVRSFLRDNLPESDVGGDAALRPRTDREFERAQAINHKLAERGWIAPAWPKQYGGLGASIFEQMVFNEEFGYYGVPDTGTRTFGVGMIGPTLIIHGSEEQKQRYLPRITSGEDIWCQGYSEPGAGSDLAGLQTRAVRDGDDYVINGHKIWTSGGHRANQMFCLVRTNPEAPKHRGISFLIVDDIKHASGLEIRPLINMANRHHFNEVFFEDVRVPARNLVGEEDRGWYIGMTLLDFERSGIGTTAAQRKTLEVLAARSRELPASQRARARIALADCVVANNASRLLGLRLGSMQAQGQVPNYEASMVKVFQSELGQQIYGFGVRMLGLAGQLVPEEPRAPLGGEIVEAMIQAVPTTIYSGTSEIQRNIIATRGLGLPRE